MIQINGRHCDSNSLIVWYGLPIWSTTDIIYRREDFEISKSNKWSGFDVIIMVGPIKHTHVAVHVCNRQNAIVTPSEF
jgi:hypothetical protein